MRFPICVAVALLALGCASDPATQLSGIYRVDLKRSALPTVPLPFPDAVEREKQLFSTFQIQLRSDRSYVLSAGTSTEGTWTLTGNQLLLTPKPHSGGFDPLGLSKSGLTGIFSPGDELTIQIPTPLGSLPIAFHKTG